MNKLDIYAISNNVKNVGNEIDVKLSKIVNIPLHKKFIYLFSKDKQLAEIENAFNYFREKQSGLSNHLTELNELEKFLNEENVSLKQTIDSIKSKPKEEQDIEILVQVESKLLINKEMLLNEIPITKELIETIIIKLEKTMPFLERIIKQKLIINGSLKTLNFVIKKIIELENYSKKLEKENSKEIKSLIESSSNTIINSIDIEYYKDMNKRNQELRELFAKSKQEYFDKLQRMEKDLSELVVK